MLHWLNNIWARYLSAESEGQGDSRRQRKKSSSLVLILTTVMFFFGGFLFAEKSEAANITVNYKVNQAVFGNGPIGVIPKYSITIRHADAANALLATETTTVAQLAISETTGNRSTTLVTPAALAVNQRVFVTLEMPISPVHFVGSYATSVPTGAVGIYTDSNFNKIAICYTVTAADVAAGSINISNFDPGPVSQIGLSPQWDSEPYRPLRVIVYKEINDALIGYYDHSDVMASGLTGAILEWPDNGLYKVYANLSTGQAGSVAGLPTTGFPTGNAKFTFSETTKYKRTYEYYSMTGSYDIYFDHSQFTLDTNVDGNLPGGAQSYVFGLAERYDISGHVRKEGAVKNGTIEPATDLPFTSGVKVELWDGTGTSILKTETVTTSGYKFTNLNPSLDYQIRVKEDTLPSATPPWSYINDYDGTYTYKYIYVVPNNAGELKERDFLYDQVPLVKVSGNIYADQDLNGSNVPADAPLPNVTVELWDSTNTIQQGTAVSNATGQFEFTDVPTGKSYNIKVIKPSTNFGIAYNSASNTNDTITTTSLVANVDSTGHYFGLNIINRNLALSGNIMVDADSNGVYSSTNDFIFNAAALPITFSIEVGGLSYPMLQKTTTSGAYSVNIPAGLWTATVDSSSLNSSVWSPSYTKTANSTTETYTQNVTATQSDWHFGYKLATGPVNISGRTVYDVNENDAYDTSDFGINGLINRLYIDVSGTYVQVKTATATDNDGNYQFQSLPAGQKYKVEAGILSLPTGLTAAFDKDGTPLNLIEATLSASETDWHFGYKGNGNSGQERDLTLITKMDSNNNATYEATDTDLASVAIAVQSSRLKGSITTGSSGQYTLKGLPFDNYDFQDTLPTGLARAYISTNGTLATGKIATLQVNGSTADPYYGYKLGTGSNTISGRIVNDSVNQGTYDAADLDLFAQTSTVKTVKLYTEISGTYVLTNESVVSPGSPTYQFTSLPNGKYKVEVVDSEWTSLFDRSFNKAGVASNIYEATISSSQTDWHFGYKWKDGSLAVSGTLVYDANNDGVKSAGDLAIIGNVSATTEVLNYTLNVAKVKSDNNGDYEVEKLVNRAYTFTNDFSSDNPNLQGVYAKPTAAGVGTQKLSTTRAIAGSETDWHFVWKGRTGSSRDILLMTRLDTGTTLNAYDTGDAARPSVALTFNPGATGAGVIVGVLSTDGTTGDLTLQNFPYGNNTVQDDSPTALTRVYKSDGSSLASANLAVNVSGTAQNYYYGYKATMNGPLKIGGTVYFDSDRSRNANSGDLVIEDVTVKIYKEISGVYTFATSQKTDASGEYSFTGIDSGVNYKVEIDPLPTSTEASFTKAGSASTLSYTGSITADATDWHFGVMGVTSSTETQDFVIISKYDTNLDHKYQTTDANLGDMSFTITGSNKYKGTITTGTATGQFTIKNLPFATYELKDVLPSAYDRSYRTGVTEPTIPTNGTISGITVNGSASPHHYGYQLKSGSNTISGRIVNDSVNQGSYDAADLDLFAQTSTVKTVKLYTEISGSYMLTHESVVSAGNPTYQFTSLPNGKYKVEVTDSGWTGLFDRSFNKAGVASNIYEATISGSETDWHFGYKWKEGSLTVSGTLVYDANDDGVKSAGDLAIIGNVSATTEVTDYTLNVAQVKSDNNGDYEVEKLVNRAYTFTNDFSSDNPNLQGVYAKATAAGVGTQKLSTTRAIAGSESDWHFVWKGRSGTSRDVLLMTRLDTGTTLNAYDTSDAARPGVALTFNPGATGAGVIVGILSTDGTTGNLTLQNFPYGNNTVQDDSPTAFTRVYKSDGSSLTSANLAMNVSSTAQDYYYGYKTNMNGPLKIEGIVYFDSDRSRSATSGDLVIEDVTVKIYKEIGGVYTFATSQKTNSDGEYSFTGIDSGVNYKVEIDPLPTSTEASFTKAGSASTLSYTGSITTDATDWHFGVMGVTSSTETQDFVIISKYDTNLDHKYQTTDANLGDMSFTITGSNKYKGTIETDTTTGQFTIKNLPFATYELKDVLPSAYDRSYRTGVTEPTIPTNGTISGITVDGSASPHHYGYQLKSGSNTISGRIVNDSVNQGSYDAADLDLFAQTSTVKTVKLYTEISGSYMLTHESVVSAGSPTYQFTSLPNGKYKVEVTDSGWTGLFDRSFNKAGVASNIYEATISSSETDWHFGYKWKEGSLTVSGTLVYDANDDGVKSVGDLAIIGNVSATTEVTDYTLNVAQVKSDNSGDYEVEKLVNRAYTFTNDFSSDNPNLQGVYAKPTAAGVGTQKLSTTRAIAGSETDWHFVWKGRSGTSRDVLLMTRLDTGTTLNAYDTGDAARPSVALTFNPGATGAGVIVGILSTDGTTGNLTLQNFPYGNNTVQDDSSTAFTRVYKSDGSSLTSANLAMNVSSTAQDYYYGYKANMNGPLKIEGIVYFDSDRSRSATSGDLVIEDVTVKIYKEIGGVYTFATSQKTNSDGEYSFTGIDSGVNYKVEIDPLPTSTEASFTKAGSASTLSYTGSITTDATDWHFGVMGVTSSTETQDFVIISKYDTNLDHKYQTTDANLGDMSFTISGDNKYKGTITTGTATGQFTIKNLPFATYELKDVLTSTYKRSYRTGVTEPNIPTDGTISGITVDGTATPHHYGYLLNNSGTLSISGTIVVDTDDDGTVSSGDLKIEKVKVNLYKKDGSNVYQAVDSILTNVSGVYTFSSLGAGDYKAVVDSTTLPNNLVAAFDKDGVPYGEIEGTLAATNLTDWHFGYKGDTASNRAKDVTLITRYDSNKDHMYDSGDAAQAGVTIDIKITDQYSGQITTNSSGEWVLKNLPFDTYVITATLPSGYKWSYRTGVTEPTIPTDGEITGFVVDSSSANPHYGFLLNSGSYSLGGTVVLDIDNSSSKTSADFGIKDVTLELYLKNSFNNYILVDNTKTDAAGDYTFSGYGNGDYRVQVKTSTLPPDDLILVFPSINQIDRTLNNANEANMDFGYKGDKGGNKARDFDLYTRYDTDLDNEYDSSTDGPEANVVISVESSRYKGSFTTDISGNYTMYNLPFGTYTFTDTLPTSRVRAYRTGVVEPNTPSDGVISNLVVNGSTSVPYYGYVYGANGPITLSGKVVFDSDESGTVSSGDLNIQNVKIALYKYNTGLSVYEKIKQTSTVTNGTYSFSGLVAGDYKAEIDSTSLPSDIIPSFDKDGATLGEIIDTAVAASQTNWDFGYKGDTSTSNVGTVKILTRADSNDNRMYDVAPTDAVLSNVTISISSSRFNGSTATNASGEWEIKNLPYGSYTVQDTLPTDYTWAYRTGVVEPNVPTNGQITLTWGTGIDNPHYGYIPLNAIDLDLELLYHNETTGVNDGVVYAGDTLTVKVRVKNITSLRADNKIDSSLITHILPAELEYVPSSLMINGTSRSDSCGDDAFYETTQTQAYFSVGQNPYMMTSVTDLPVSNFSILDSHDEVIVTLQAKVKSSLSAGTTIDLEAIYSGTDRSFLIQRSLKSNLLRLRLDKSGYDIWVTKEAAKSEVTLGELVPYRVTIENLKTTPFTNIDLYDAMPLGFRYVPNSLKIDGVKTEPTTINGRDFRLTGINLPANGKIVVTYLLAVTQEAPKGDAKNEATMMSSSSLALSNTAVAYVRVKEDELFEKSLIIGKVFHDRNGNGYQDEGEEGLPGVKLATLAGQIITTDAYGRYHVPAVDAKNWERGSNFVVKLDIASLPKGTKITTRNPLLVMVTPGMPSKANFGVQLKENTRTVEIEK